MRRKAFFTAVGLAVILVGASVATAAKPERLPLINEPTVHGILPDGSDDPFTHVCAFPVELSQRKSNYAITFFGETRLQITGSGLEQAMNLSNDKSVTFPTSGKSTQTVLPNGDLRFQAAGRTLFYFYPGDLGPFGPVDEHNGALYYIVGHVDEILDPDNFFAVTSFEWSGTATEVCSLIDD
jgi:hypothetical protein